MFQRGLAACAVALLLVCVPMGLKAQEKEARAVDQASVGGWIAGLWGEVTMWVVKKVVPLQPLSSAIIAGGCDIDPDGCPGGA